MGRVAVLGTGIMGGPMARNLLRAGHEVTVWNRTIEKAEALEEEAPASHRHPLTRFVTLNSSSPCSPTRGLSRGR